MRLQGIQDKRTQRVEKLKLTAVTFADETLLSALHSVLNTGTGKITVSGVDGLDTVTVWGAIEKQ